MSRLANRRDLRDQRVDDEPFGIDRHAANLQPVIAKHLEREEVRRLLDDHDIAGLGQHRAQHLERLRVAVGREQLLGVHRRAVRLAEKLTEREPVVSVAPLCAVLQELGRVVELHLGGAAHVVDRQDRVVRLPDAEVDHTFGNHHLLKLNRRHRSNVGP